VADLVDLEKFLENSYRESYLDSHVRSSISYQIQALRSKLSLNQTEFGMLVGMPQSVISRLESMDHSVSVATLLNIANKLKIGLQIRFCNFETVVDEDVSPQAMTVETIDETMVRRVAATTSQMAAPVVIANVPIETLTVEGTAAWQTTLQASPPPFWEFPESGTHNIERYMPMLHSPVLAHSILV
jgi:transcriptional regulator with XRE-family HTH domain